jgi:hypothetical protein
VKTAEAQLFGLDTAPMTATPPAGAALGHPAHPPDDRDPAGGDDA